MDNEFNSAEAFQMPHLEYSSEEQGRAYPRLEVPEAELLDSTHEVKADQANAVLQHGLQIAKFIRPK